MKMVPIFSTTALRLCPRHYVLGLLKSKSKTKEENQKMKNTKSKSSAVKPEPKPVKGIRTNRISLRLNEEEIALIQSKAQSQDARTLARYVRNSALESLPITIPEINQESWTKLSTVVSNLNQLQRRINSNQIVGVDEIKTLVADLRAKLIGVTFNNNNIKDEA